MKNRENLADLSEQELKDKFLHYKEELFNLRFQVVTGQLTNNTRISVVRKNIARVQTVISKLEKEKIFYDLKEEYEAMVVTKGIDPKLTPLRIKLEYLKTQLSGKANKVNREIAAEVNLKISELLKSIQKKISEKLLKLKGADGKEESKWRSASRVVRNANPSVRLKTLDKLLALGINEAAQIKTLKETKRVKLIELERMRTLQRGLANGKLPF